MERAAGRANAHEKQRVLDERCAKQREEWEKGMRVQEAREASEKAARTKLNRVAGQAKAKQTRASRQQSPATTRAIEHAKAAGPSLREQAEKARAGKGMSAAVRSQMAGAIKGFRKDLSSRGEITSEQAGRLQKVVEKAKERISAPVPQYNRPGGYFIEQHAKEYTKERAIARTYSRAARRLNLR